MWIATPVAAPETDLTADVDAILARVSPATRVVFIANPNNPTGTYLPFDEVKRLRAGLPDDVLLVYGRSAYVWAYYQTAVPVSVPATIAESTTGIARRHSGRGV